MLCPPCRNLTLTSLHNAALTHPPGSRTGWNQSGYLTLHPSFSSLVSNSQDGCPNCTLYLQHFSTAFPEQIVRLREEESRAGGKEEPVVAFLVIANWIGGKQYITKLQLQIGTRPWRAGDEGERFCVGFRISRPRDVRAEGLNFRYTQIDHNLGSDTNVDVAREWIRTCSEEHDPSICPSIQDTELPTRLVDVSSPIPKLILTSPSQRGRYLALSHCWGASITGERLVTVSNNIDLRLAGIPLDTMPANFRDACIATRKLGYQYVWIDSLCIIQDLKEDWEHESALMGDIYTKASLTLAAAAAKSSDGGMFDTRYEKSDFKNFAPSKWFLVDRKESNRYALSDETPAPTSPELKSCYVPLSHDGNMGEVELTPWNQFSDLEENWFRCVVVGPLAHRGWTLQERMLSPRSLYYGNRQIYWQCPSARLAADGESVPTGAATSVWNQSDSEHSEWPDLLSLRQLKKPLSEQGQRKVHSLWRDVLRIYVSRLLTKQSDKLPALAGMAAFLNSITHDEYLAGLWARDLHVSLLWTHIPIWAKGAASLDYVIQVPQWDLPPRERSLEAPSWSWAGADVRDRLYFWTAGDENGLWGDKDVQVLRHGVELAGRNPFGAVKSGRLTLRGHVYERWDGRVEGWNPLQVGWTGAGDAVSEFFCLHSARYDVDRVVLWDYPPRHGMRVWPKLLRLLSQLFWTLLALLLWQGWNRVKEVHDRESGTGAQCKDGEEGS
ncbi:hypothetical protein LARI1_G007897 [Lachnellula arida]|uniref:Heterokaryon incompatibility domain-containing protein n=1 Tax=Lachnellula arida TaxID=1316785 RepID=A0A8T9B8I9_9HELO|nr:hypothetical protein LARI1_G007897 [Lachnellula arida]